MTDQPTSGDELASAMLDDEIPRPARVDAELAERVEELRGASRAIAAPLPIDEVARERAIAAALVEFDVAAATPPAPSVPRRRYQSALLGAAAAVIVLIGAVAVIRRDDTSPTNAASGAATTASAEALSGASAVASTVPVLAGGGASPSTVRAATGNADAATEAAAPAAPSPSPQDLGDVSDEDALRAKLGAEAFAAKASGVTSVTCEAEVRKSSTADLGPLTDNVTLSWQGQPARALVFLGPSGAGQIVVVADPTCEVLDLLG